ncbi:MAG TPA: choice-of-anchor tandem repeat GloVer-containing protein [Terriglobales bacterium]|nr:choice-of-anchor tandem repeat GloVer-containing protein [Terriglobales bacterium]
MQGKSVYIASRAVLAIFMVTVLAATAYAATETVLHNFNDNGTDGYYPYGALIFDKAGNLYGTTVWGGTNNMGTVFELTPKGGGGWTETVLHNFGGAKDGSFPWGTLIFDAAGNLYGTTQTGGTYEYGTVFEMTPGKNGVWKEKVLHSFNGGNGKDGVGPLAGVIFDGSGNLYGTTELGGLYSFGIVFELSPKTGGGWTEKILHSFNPNTKDGVAPNASLIFDTAGNLYGTTLEGGTSGVGTVFELSAKTGGGWKEKLLHSFNSSGKDGYFPFSALTFDGSGNLYGATSVGGTKYGGIAFELTPKTGGGWTEKILYDFGYPAATDPFSQLIFDGSGNLYGTTGTNGPNDSGSVFKLTPRATGKWAATVLHNFNGTDGDNAHAGVVFDNSGNLYGTTYNGGNSTSCKSGCGTVFEIKP